MLPGLLAGFGYIDTLRTLPYCVRTWYILRRCDLFLHVEIVPVSLTQSVLGYSK